MLSEKQYRAALDVVLNIPKGFGANWNNDFILGLAMNGLCLLPITDPQPPFAHYVMAPWAEMEDRDIAFHRLGEPLKGSAWSDSWIVDHDWKEHVRPVAIFNFTPLKK
jgi:hypothetical protein